MGNVRLSHCLVSTVILGKAGPVIAVFRKYIRLGTRGVVQIILFPVMSFVLIWR